MPLLTDLLRTEELVALYHASELPGEEYHPGYKKNMDIFRKIARSDMETESEMGLYFEKQAKRVIKNTDWDAYEVRKASLLDMVTVKWVDDKLNLTLLLGKTLVDALEAGGEFTQIEQKIDSGWSSNDAPAVEFLNKYTPKLAGNLTDTTIDRIKSSLKYSVTNGESTAEAKARLFKVINDKKRAASIAHTESVRAFTGGRLLVGYEYGADRKRWDTTSKPCAICAEQARKGAVPIDKPFSNGIWATPAHPNCRCLIKLLLPENGKPKQWDNIADRVIKQMGY